MSIHARLNERIELRLNQRVSRSITLHEVRHDDVRVRPQRRHFQNQRVDTIDRIRRIQRLPEIIRPDVQQNHIRVRKRAKPRGHICIELINPPPAVPLVVLVRDARTVRRQRADVIHVVACGGERRIEFGAIPAEIRRPARAKRDGIAHRQNTNRRRLRVGGDSEEQSEDDPEKRRECVHGGGAAVGCEAARPYRNHRLRKARMPTTGSKFSKSEYALPPQHRWPVENFALLFVVEVVVQPSAFFAEEGAVHDERGDCHEVAQL